MGTKRLGMLNDDRYIPACNVYMGIVNRRSINEPLFKNKIQFKRPEG